MKKVLLLISFAFTLNLSAQDVEEYSVEDINNTNYLYNLQRAVYKLIDENAENKKQFQKLNNELLETKNELKSTNLTLSNLQKSLKTINNSSPLSFDVTEEDKKKIKNFLNNK
jgi:predicted  nucleic acid-binding Zn-ribbon protein